MACHCSCLDCHFLLTTELSPCLHPRKKGAMANTDAAKRHFPIAAGILFGLGLGGFFDGIVLHQLLQWHHMLSSWYPINSLENLELNTRWDGIFHSSTYVFVVVGLFLLWQAAHRQLYTGPRSCFRHYALRLRCIQRRRGHHRSPDFGRTSRQ